MASAGVRRLRLGTPGRHWSLAASAVRKAAPRASVSGTRGFTAQTPEFQVEPRTYANETLATLQSRQLLQSISSAHLSAHLSSGPRSIYLGIDPTARSLHVGNLLPIIALIWLVKAGHRGVLLVGGATGSIGDPSGKTSERSDLPKEVLDANVAAITQQVKDLVQRIGHHLAIQSTTIETPMGEAAAAASGGKGAEEAAEAAFATNAETGATTPAPGSQPRADSDSRSNTQLDITVLNNAEFYKDLGILSFLKDIGRFVRIGEVLARDSVKTRLPPPHGTSESPNAGLSFTEFSYQLLQAYDFYVLNQKQDLQCTVQLGGSDQMGNIMAGVELIRRKVFGAGSTGDIDDTAASSSSSASTYSKGVKRTPPAFALTLPLLTTSSGEKLGKSAGNAVFLCPDMCSDFDLYQYFLRVSDVDAERLLSSLTFLSHRDIEDKFHHLASQRNSSVRAMQSILAEEMTLMLRGAQALAKAKYTTNLIYNSLFRTKSHKDLAQLVRDQRETLWERLSELVSDPVDNKQSWLVKKVKRSDCVGKSLLDLFFDLGFAESRCKSALLSVFIGPALTRRISPRTTTAQLRSMLKAQAGLYVNNEQLSRDKPQNFAKTKLQDWQVTSLEKDGAKTGRGIFLLRKGKADLRVVLVE